MAIDPRDAEICIHGTDLDRAPGAVVPPIAQTALFAHRSFDQLITGLGAEHCHQVYTRGCNPTVQALEDKLAALERGEACRCFASGMAAISAVFLGLLEAGDHVLFVNHTYGPTLQLAQHLERFDVAHDVVLDVDPEAVTKALKPETRLLWMESPGTMLFRTLDLAALAALARSRQIVTAIDNSWATPLFQKPLPLGVDLAVHACSKYLGGHSDVIAGAVVGSEALMEQIFYRALLLNGGILAPFDAWLVIRGLRTLPARMRQHQDDAIAVARWLDRQPKVRRVHHPRFRETTSRRGTSENSTPSEDGQLTGTSGLFSFELVNGDFDRVRRVIDALTVFRIGVSWGGPESLVISPERGDNAEQLKQQGIPPGLIRLSIGLEGAETLIDDLEHALARI